jgi:phenol/toluene 2-monooxygenase (NADH) P5/A5
MSIKKYKGKITNIIDLSKTAKEVHVELDDAMEFAAGSFVNVFMDIDGVKVRRAYSIASASDNHKNIVLAIRLSPDGVMTKLFWTKDMKGEIVELMGPLGLNTVDKMNHRKIFLFAFGIGSGVVKSIAHYFSFIEKRGELVIMTGSKSEDEIIYRDYFNGLARDFDHVRALHVVSRETENPKTLKGYIQDHIDKFDFNNSDVYVCGQEKACTELVDRVRLMNPEDCHYFIEAFH